MNAHINKVDNSQAKKEIAQVVSRIANAATVRGISVGMVALARKIKKDFLPNITGKGAAELSEFLNAIPDEAFSPDDVKQVEELVNLAREEDKERV